MPMRMTGNRDGTDELPAASVLARFPVAPLRMQMSMHMVGAMVAPSERLTLMGMLPIIDRAMDHRTRAGGQFATSAAGVGDIKLAALLRLFNRDGQAMHVNLGLSVPTGAIDETDVTPASAPSAAVLPYPMQLGSGTWDVTPGVTLLGRPTAGRGARRASRRFALARTIAATGSDTVGWEPAGSRAASTVG
jgi:hypothetical protein